MGSIDYESLYTKINHFMINTFPFIIILVSITNKIVPSFTKVLWIIIKVPNKGNDRRI